MAEHPNAAIIRSAYEALDSPTWVRWPRSLGENLLR